VNIENPELEAAYTGKQIQIMGVAERLFAIHGFEGTSVRDIAQEAGVNVAMISYYFGSKEKLLLAVFNHRISASRLALEHLLNDRKMHPLDKIDALVDGMVDRMMKHKNFHRVMQHSQLSADNAEIAEIIAQIKLKNLELVNKIIAEGQRKKVFVKDIDGAMLMMTVSGTVYQAATGSVYFRATDSREALTEEAYQELVNTKLKTHLKRVLKATLTYEGK
jgi:AcrR family transcriptional regulator